MSLMRRLEIDVAAVFGTTGVTIFVIGLAQLLPVVVALWVGAAAWPLLLGALATIAAGAGLLPLRHQAVRKATRRDSLAIVSVSWLAAILAGAVPFLVTGACGPIDAVFESASGLTTTGASIFPDVDRLSTTAATGPSVGPDRLDAPLHLWRALSHWLGGAGIVLVVVVLTPFLGDVESLRRTQRSETSLLTERYRGSTRATMKGLIAVYLGATALNTVLLVVAGMTPWDALLHAFSTIATGGFSNTTASLGAWGAAVQLVTVVFMVVGALNFVVLGRAAEEIRARWTHARREHGRRAALGAAVRGAPGIFGRTVWRSGEARGYLGLLAVASLLVTVLLFLWGSPARYSSSGAQGLWNAFVDATFNVVSISSTTGFGSQDYTGWPPACQVVLLSLMFVGGCSGSTAGGIKLRRVMIVGKYAHREARRFAHPRAVFPIRLGDAVVSEEQVREALGFVATYLGLAVVGGLILALSGSDMVTSGSASVAALGSVGPGFGEVGPAGNFQALTGPAKLTLCLVMLLGRLEIYPLVTTLLPSFWVRRGGHAPVG
jgi:trk system potassium uptake protein TrkH